MGEAEEAKKKLTVEDIKRQFAPVRIGTRSHGSILLSVFGSQSHYRAVASAVTEHKSDSYAFSVVVLESLLDEISDQDPADVAFYKWKRQDLANVLNDYMGQPRSRFVAPHESDDEFDDFAAQCKTKLDDHIELGRQAVASIQKAIAPFGVVAESISKMTKFFDAESTFPSIMAVDRMLEPSRWLSEAIEPFASVQSESFLGVTNSMQLVSDSLIGLQPKMWALDGFFRQANQLRETIDTLLRHLEERIKNDKHLRALGIDIERLRLTGGATWLSLIYAVLYQEDENTETSRAIIELASSKELQSEVFKLLDAMPDAVRDLRVEAIRQGLDAHNTGSYISSCTVLLAQLDGLLGDFLVEFEKASGVRGSRRRDLKQRIKALEDLNDPEHNYPSVIAAQYGVVEPPFGMGSEKHIGFARTRHEIMHGHPDAPYCIEQSARFVFLILSLLSVHISLDDEI